MADENSNSIVDLASNLTVAWLSNPSTRANTDEATGFLKSIHDTLASFSGTAPAPASPAASPDASAGSSTAHEPAVTVRKSLASPNHILSLIDGKPYTTLKRHLGSHGLTPDQYRARYGLKSDYPMVAPAYAAKRRELAKKIGLGRKPSEKAPAKPAGAAAKPKPAKAPAAAGGAPRKRGRPPKASS